MKAYRERRTGKNIPNRFIDSFRFMSSSADSLIRNLLGVNDMNFLSFYRHGSHLFGLQT